MKLPRDSRVLRHRLSQAIWDANHNRERELDAIFDTIEAYVAEEGLRESGQVGTATCVEPRCYHGVQTGGGGQQCRAHLSPAPRPEPTACCKKGESLAEDWVARYKCPIHGWQDNQATVNQWVIVAVHLSTEGVAYFWGPNFSGYTRDLEKAGRYTETEAKAREKWTERMEVAVPFAEAQSVAHPAVCDDDAHRWFHRRFPNGRP